MTDRLYILFNARSGAVPGLDLTAEALAELFAAQGMEAELDTDSHLPLVDRARRAAASGARVVVAAGGDGTATVTASALMNGDKALAVLPLGTANLLARDLRLPLELDPWFATLPRFQSRKIDVGEVNGHIFLHKVVVGTIPGLAAAREKMRGHDGLGARLRFLGHLFSRLARAGRFALEVTPHDGEPRIEVVQAFAVVNNDYDEGLGQVFSRARLDAGTLSVYMLRRLRPLDAIRLALEMLLGTWRQDDVISVENVKAVTIRTRRKRVKAMIDGEVETLSSPLDFGIRPLALNVLAPAPETEGEEAAPAEPALATDDRAR